MPRMKRPNTAEVTLRFRVPKGATAAQVKRLFENTYKGQLEIDPDWDEAEVFGDRVIKPKIVGAKVIKRADRLKAERAAADAAYHQGMTEAALLQAGKDPGDYGLTPAAAIAAEMERADMLEPANVSRDRS